MDRPARKLLTNGWLYLPAVSGPIGGGLIKLGGGSTWAAAVVGAAPYAVCVLAYSVFLIGYMTALIRYICSGPEAQESMERLIAISANSIVGILTLTRVTLPGRRPKAAEKTTVGRRRTLSTPATTETVATRPGSSQGHQGC